MFGKFQQSQLRIEVPASSKDLGDRLLTITHLREWLFPLALEINSTDVRLKTGQELTTAFGPIVINQKVDYVDDANLRLILSNGIDGYHEWMWGDGWVQSCIAGVSLIPINLSQTITLLRFTQSLQKQN